MGLQRVRRAAGRFLFTLEIALKVHILAAALAAAPIAWASDRAADAAAPVAPPVYRSVFDGIPAGVEQESIHWRAANAAVAEFPRGHIDLLKWEKAVADRAGTSAPAAAPTNGDAAPAQGAGGGHRH